MDLLLICKFHCNLEDTVAFRRVLWSHFTSETLSNNLSCLSPNKWCL